MIFLITGAILFFAYSIWEYKVSPAHKGINPKVHGAIEMSYLTARSGLVSLLVLALSNLSIDQPLKIAVIILVFNVFLWLIRRQFKKIVYNLTIETRWKADQCAKN
jgi:hypothetical protein